MKTRAQFSTYNFHGVTTKGSVLLHDVIIEQGKFQCTARYALFDTDDFENRHYIYEHDVWLGYSLPAYTGIGIKRYILLEYKMNRHICFWLRYAHTRYMDRTEIGSGADTINGNTQNDIKFEIRLRF